jgi:hypothetical protein
MLSKVHRSIRRRIELVVIERSGTALVAVFGEERKVRRVCSPGICRPHGPAKSHDDVFRPS